MPLMAKTPKPPYYAVIFTSTRTEIDDGYTEMAAKMLALARQQPGFLGVESAREQAGITVSYWSDLQAVHEWKHNLTHKKAQKMGREKWYAAFTVRIANIERDYRYPS